MRTRVGVRSGAWLFGFLVLMLWSGPVWATITNPTATIINDQNGDGIAGVGDTIEFSCNSDNATAGQTPYVNLSPLGTARFILPQVVGTYYSAIFTVTQGSYDGVYTAPFVDNTSPVPCGNALTIDSQRPNSTTGAIVTAGNGPNGEYRIGDSLRVDISMTTPFDSDTPSIDLTPIGLGGTNFFGGAWPNFSYTRTFPANREGTGKVLTVSSTDNAGNRRSWNVSIDYDTKAPDVQTVQASINSGNAIARIGDVITVTATVAGYDTDTLIASSSQLWGGSVTMTRVGSPAPGAAATFQVQRAIPANLRVQDVNAQVMVTATDDVGNQTVAYSNYLSVDTIEPRFNNSPQALLIERRGILADNIGVIGDNLIIRGDLTAVMDDVTVTVDISGIGGVTNQLLYKAPGSTSFYLDFPINQYTSEDYTPRSFNVKGIDTAGNVKYEITLPVIYVDNQPPSLSGAQLAKVTTGNATAKIGDQIRLQVNVTNLDGGSIWADLRRIGGTGSDTFTPAGGSTYDLTFTVAAPAPTYGTLDGNLAFPIYCRDNAGNEASVVTNQLSFDNEPPVISAFSYSVNPPLGPGHTYVKVGDQITFNVTLANAGAQPHDTETVTMNLSSIGGLNNQVFNYDGAGNYSYTQVVQIGALNGPSANFVAIATDNAGNAVSQIFNVPIDNYPPAPGPMTVAPNRDNAKTGWMNVGVDDGAGNFTNPDRWEFAVPCTDPDNGVCTIDLSLVGGSPTATMNYDAALQRYYLLVDLAPATVRNTAYVFRATVKDKAGNTFNSVSGQQIVECVPPVINSVTSALSLDPNGNNIANVNDQITLTANVDRSRLNGGVPMVNVQSIGGLSAQQMYDDGAHGDNAPNDGVYGWIETVKKGNINGVLTSFAVSITDNAQNQVTRVTAPVRVANNPIVLSSFTGQQTVDTNNNGWLDLDGIYTTSSTWATDVVSLKLRVTGTPGTLGPVTLDLTPLGINDAAYPLAMTQYSSYWEGVASFSPLPGTTNRQSIIFNAVINDTFGNVTYATTSAALKIDNQAPTLTIYPVAFVQDTGIIGEANAGDIIRVKVRVNGHDDGGSPGILPQIDLTNLYLDNGLNPPSPILFPPTGGPNEYQYDWTVPVGLGTISSLTIIAYDYSGNMVAKPTQSIRFLSKVPAIRGFADTRCDLITDTQPPIAPNNRIANPGDQVKIQVMLDSAYNIINTPAAKVLVDVRSIMTEPASDDAGFDDGNSDTAWRLLTPPVVGALGPWVYQQVFTVGYSRRTADVASFAVKVVHPDNNAVTMASSDVICDPNNPFGIDGLMPDVYFSAISITKENYDNVSSGVANIGDELTVTARIRDYPDPASVSVFIYDPNGTQIQQLTMIPTGVSDWYSATINVATAGIFPWAAPVINFDRNLLRYQVWATCVADNAGTGGLRTATFTVDNTEIPITDFKVTFSPNNPELSIANIGNGVASDAIIASITCAGVGFQAFMNYSAFLSTSSWPLDQSFNGGLGRFSLPFLLGTGTLDLATYTIPVNVVETLSGNRTATYTLICIDTTRPRITRARYDGQYLWLDFSEAIKLTPLPTALRFDHTKLHIGRDVGRMGYDDATYTAFLGPNDIVQDTLFDGTQVQIKLASTTQARIADWGVSPLYLSAGTTNLDGEGASITTDIAGNWLKPIPQNTPMTIEIVPYLVRPNLIGGYYDAVNDPTRLYLDFDRDMATETLRSTWLSPFSVVRNRTEDSLPVNYQNRYVMRDSIDTVGSPINLRRLVINLSPEAQDWIAYKFTRNSPYMWYGIATTTEPLVRDQQGNRVGTISLSDAVIANLVPENRGFDVRVDGTTPILDINTGILTMHTSRRALLFADDFNMNSPTWQGKTIANMSPSKIIIYRNPDRSGPSLNLNGAVLDPAMNDNASTTCRLLLTQDHIRTMLSWATANVYVTFEPGTFLDLWSNPSNRVPANNGNAVPLNLPIPTYSGQPVILNAAISDAPPTKQWTPGTLFFEVDFGVGTLSTGVEVPINQNKQPRMEIWGQDGSGPLLVASFAGWLTHTINGKNYTTARFSNRDIFAGGLQNVPAMFVFPDNDAAQRVEDVFGKPLFPVIQYNSALALTPLYGAVASMVYDLSQKIDVGTGYNTGSQALIIDTAAPIAVAAGPCTPTVIGLTPINTGQFFADFNESMDTSAGRWPTMRIRNGAGTTMVTMTFAGWANGNTRATFTNSAAINADIEPGTYLYEVSGGYDLAGNPGSTISGATWTVDIRARGAQVTKVTVRTFQSTTAKGTGDILVNQPFSPNVAPGLATITIDFGAVPVGQQYLHLYQGGVSVASFAITMTNAITGVVVWDGRINGTLVTTSSPQTYELVVMDDGLNEGSQRGVLTYDERAPEVLSWNISRAKYYNGNYYFSPSVQGYMKIDVFGPAAGESLKIRALRPTPVPGSVDTYLMVPLAGSGYTLSWDGKSTDPGTPLLQNGTYGLNLVDAAGNVGIQAGPTAVATATVIIDTVAPAVATMSLLVNGQPRSRFNPNVGFPLNINVTMNAAPAEASGTVLVRIMAGANTIRDIQLGGAHPAFTCNWDGRDGTGVQVPDGTYRVRVIDMAENMSTPYMDVDVITSVFKVSKVEQVSKRKLRVTFSTEVDAGTLGLATNYSLSPVNPSGIGVITGGPVVSGRIVELPLNLDLVHDLDYTLTAAGTSIDGDTLLPPYNTGTFHSDSRGPLISNVTFDGVSSQKEFNVVFDEQVDPTSAARVANYTVTSGSGTVAIVAAILRGDNASVKLTANADLSDGVNYTVIASGVLDLYANPSNGTQARATFTGRDVTPPVLTITVFSNPANEFDLVVAVRSNKPLNGAPAAQVTQSGGSALSFTMTAGPSNLLWIGGAHLDSSFPGVATIKVTATDLNGNQGSNTTSFSTAFVNASRRADVRSPDGRFLAVFPTGSLKSDTWVSIVPQQLSRSTGGNGTGNIRASVLGELNRSQLAALRLDTLSGEAGSELEPTGPAYVLNIPAGRLAQPVDVAWSLTGGTLATGTALYRLEGDGLWHFVSRTVQGNVITAKATGGATYALLRDATAPSVRLATDLLPGQPIKTNRPIIEWDVTDNGAGLDPDTVGATIDGVSQAVEFDPTTGRAILRTTIDLCGGQHTLSIHATDRAGNRYVSPATIFAVQPQLALIEAEVFPNPARTFSRLRVALNRDDVIGDRIEAKIYDVAGGRVRTLDNVMPAQELVGANQRQLYDINWDLTDDEGRKVANGVYLLKIRIQDPESDRTMKLTKKVVVLR